MPGNRYLQNTHWWNAGMRKITLALLADSSLPDGPLLDIGCGEGALAEDLVAAYPDHSISGLDLNIRALIKTPPFTATTQFAQADYVDLPIASKTCAAITALNVLDQKQVRPEIALAESWRVLRSGGILLVSVGAYEWLYGPHDQAFGSGRRYTATDFRQLLVSAEFIIERITYANSLLLIPAIATRLAQQYGFTSIQQGLATAPSLNRLLATALNIEARWLRRHHFPAGLSLYALARKP